MSSNTLFSISAAATVLLGLGVFPGCGNGTGPERPVLEAAAVLRDASGATIGSARLAQGRSGAVTLNVSVAGLSVGTHGIHVHAVGSCQAANGTAFAGAGGHFNPLAKSHGLSNPQGAHGGDLPNLEVGEDGEAHYSATTDRFTLSAGPATLVDADGAAIVIHAGADDQVSDPAGNSGARIACGVIELK